MRILTASVISLGIFGACLTAANAAPPVAQLGISDSDSAISQVAMSHKKMMMMKKKKMMMRKKGMM